MPSRRVSPGKRKGMFCSSTYSLWSLTRPKLAARPTIGPSRSARISSLILGRPPLFAVPSAKLRRGANSVEQFHLSAYFALLIGPGFLYQLQGEFGCESDPNKNFGVFETSPPCGCPAAPVELPALLHTLKTGHGEKERRKFNRSGWAAAWR